jgi:GDP-L-fucose synthase
MMKVLITGANGMVGRNLLAHPAADRYEILAPSSRELNLCNGTAVVAYLETHRPDGVVHLAAVVGGIQANIDEPVRFLAANTEMALTLFQAVRSLGIKRILNVASSCIYPRNVSGTLSTDLLLSGALEPTNEGYAIGKIFSWKLLEYMGREDTSLHYKTVVPCNLYGLHDHFDLRKAHLVPAAIMKVAQSHDSGVRDVSIWGDGTARREFMFAADFADFIWWALPQIEHLPSPLNVGLGMDWSVKDYYEKIGELVGYHGRFSFDTSKPAGMKRKLLDVREVHKLGWRAPTSLESGLGQTIAHYRALVSA